LATSPIITATFLRHKAAVLSNFNSLTDHACFTSFFKNLRYLSNVVMPVKKKLRIAVCFLKGQVGVMGKSAMVKGK
jgi:hypothetical protein